MEEGEGKERRRNFFDMLTGLNDDAAVTSFNTCGDSGSRSRIHLKHNRERSELVENRITDGI